MFWQNAASYNSSYHIQVTAVTRLLCQFQFNQVLNMPSMVTAPSRYMEKTFLSLSINIFLFVCLLSGKLVRLEFSLLSRLREHSFLRMKLLITDYEFLYLSVLYICFVLFCFYFGKVNKHYLRLWYMQDGPSFPHSCKFP